MFITITVQTSMQDALPDTVFLKFVVSNLIKVNMSSILTTENLKVKKETAKAMVMVMTKELVIIKMLVVLVAVMAMLEVLVL